VPEVVGLEARPAAERAEAEVIAECDVRVASAKVATQNTAKTTADLAPRRPGRATRQLDTFSACVSITYPHLVLSAQCLRATGMWTSDLPLYLPRDVLVNSTIWRWSKPPSRGGKVLPCRSARGF
jgi:hypothetical protein